MSNTLSDKSLPRLTKAQLKALERLPCDGSWRMDPGRLTSALNSLSLAPGKPCVGQWGDFGARGGRKQRWQLSINGIELKKSLVTKSISTV